MRTHSQQWSSSAQPWPSSHSPALKVPHPGESERDKADPAGAVSWDPTDQAGVFRGLPSKGPL